MKVVLFCGGLGMRMRGSETDAIPKPMALVGGRPLLWHVMRYYAHFGHTDFILAMGYGANHISRYFLEYDEVHHNDFVLEAGAAHPLSSDVADWRITFVHTGIETPIGERLRRVRDYLGNDEVFLANYADVLTDAPLNDVVSHFTATDAVASLLAVPPQSAFHVVSVDDGRAVRDIHSVASLRMRENGGYFVMRSEIFDHLDEQVDLVGDTLTKLAHQGRVVAYPYDGFWMPADTIKEREVLERLAASGHAPWELWAGHGPTAGTPGTSAAPLSGR